MTAPFYIVGNRLAHAREMRGMTQAQVAYIAGMKPSAVSHFENHRRLPSCANLRKLAETLNVSADFLLGLSSNADPR